MILLQITEGIDVIFFDLDDTLFDHNQSEDHAIISICEANGIKSLPHADITKLWKETSRKYYEKYLSGKISFGDQRILRTKEFFKILLSRAEESSSYSRLAEMSAEDADQIHIDYLKHYEQSWVLFDDVIPSLCELKEFRLGIITNGEKAQQIQKLSQLGINKYFEIILTSHELGVAKPDPQIFLSAAKKAGVDIAECMYVGDNINKDVLPAIESGMLSVWINRNSLEVGAPEGSKMILSMSEVLELANCNLIKG